MPLVARITFYLSLFTPLLVSCCTLHLLDNLHSYNAQGIFVSICLGLAFVCPLYSAIYCACKLDRSTAAKVGFGALFAIGFYSIQWAVFYAGCNASGGYL